MFNEELTLKLSYEWKNIYRKLLQADLMNSGSTTTKKLNQILLSHNVSLTKEEIRRLVKLSRDDHQTLGYSDSTIDDSINTKIDYV